MDEDDVNLNIVVGATGVRDAVSQLEALEKTLRGAVASGGDATAAVAALEKGLYGVRDAYKAMAIASPGASKTGLVAAFGSPKDIEAVRRAQNALAADAVRDADRINKANRDIAQARRGQASAREDIKYQNDLANATTELERAQIRLTRATQQEARAQGQAFSAMGRAAQARKQYGATSAQAVKAEQEYTRALQGVARATGEVRSAQASLDREHEGGGRNAFQSSYSYFVLAGLATSAARAIRDVGAAAFSASSQIERSFIDVERTFDGTSIQVESLREELRSLSTSTPISFIDLAEIATLGNQLGIASADIESFTSVIAQYTAVSGQSANDAATAFGRISNLTGLAASEYSNLASAIAYTARTTVATEGTIQNTAKEIAALSSGAGFSAQAIVGLAGALSSLAIPPERARGALSLYFGALNSAVAEGGPKLQAFAELTGRTTDELENLVRQNRGEEVFTSFIKGLSDLDAVAKTTALKTLGLSTIRVDQTMRALSQNVPLVTKSLEGSARAFQENAEIGSQYARIQEALDSKWKELQNSIQNVAGALGDRFAPAAKVVLDLLTGMIVAVTDFVNTPLGNAVTVAAGLIAALVGSLAAVVGVAALARASLVVLGFSIKQLGWSTKEAGLHGWIASLVSTDRATRAAALSTGSFTTALGATRAGLDAVAIRARVAAVALNLVKLALPIVALTGAIWLFD